MLIGRESFAPHVAPLAREHSLPAVLCSTEPDVRDPARRVTHDAAERLIAGFAPSPDDVVADICRVAAGTWSADLTAIANPAISSFAPLQSPPTSSKACESRDRCRRHAASNFKRLKRPLDIVAAADDVLRVGDARNRQENTTAGRVQTSVGNRNAAGRLASGRGVNTVFVMVGDGPYRPDVEEACRRTGVFEHFRFPGWVEHEQMPEWMNLADIVVMPSEAEAQSLVYLEAQACGRVLVGERHSGAREVIDDGRTVLLSASRRGGPDGEVRLAAGTRSCVGASDAARGASE